MKLVKSLLLGSAAGLAAIAGAQAADLPVRKAEPVEYVRVCSAYGASFFYIPGTDTCLRVGGRVRAEYRYLEPFDRSDDAIGFRARGRLNIDARTPTAYGTLRAYIRYEITRDTGSYNFPVNGVAATNADVAQAFVQFGGLTAGRITSFFANADIATQHFGTLRFDDTPDLPALAYTFSFGGGFSASVALEDNISRRNTGLPVGLLGTTFGLPTNVIVPPFNFPFASYVPAGDTAPDFVANVKYVGTWGNAMLAGAVHQIRDLGVPAAFSTVTGLPIPGTPRLFNDAEYGWAISPSVQFNLPFFAAGDYFWVVGTYSQGAPNYAGFAGGDNRVGNLSGDFTATSLVADATINAFTGQLEKTDVWSIAANFTHFWVPTLRSSIFGSYANVQFGSGSSTFLTTAPFAGLSVGFTDFNEIRIGGNTIWSPVAGLNLGLEVMYTRVDFDNRVPAFEAGALANAVRPAGTSDVNVWEGRLRVQRDF
jgi:Porin subfamily